MNRNSTAKTALLVVSASVAAVAAVAAVMVPAMGSWLVAEQALEAADTAVILMGSTLDRVLEAHDLYLQGLVSGIVMVRSRQIAEEYALERGLRIPGNADLAAGALLAVGIPEQQIIILPGRAASTRDEARLLKSYLLNHPDIRSLILVTSAYHSRRADMVFRKEFKDANIDIQIAPSKYTGFQPRKWYRHRDSTKWTVLEYIKIVAWRLRF